MDKKPLIGVSICAVVILVLGSLSNEVVYQSEKSTNVNDSPLFTTRTQRATNQHQNIITSQYLGKGIGNLYVGCSPIGYDRLKTRAKPRSKIARL